MRKLLTKPDSNPKIAKGMKRGVMTFALHLAPANLSGFEVCPMRSAGCTQACLNTAGRGRFDNVQLARIARTKLYFNDRHAFMNQLVKEIHAAKRYAEKRGYDLAVRLNATSDIPWHRVTFQHWGETFNLMEYFAEVQFYDYTKVAKRLISEQLPANYHLTFSRCEDNAKSVQDVLQAGGNVAVVFRDKALRNHAIATGFLGFPVIDGDETDLRFLDPRGVIVGLYAKGKAKKDTSGFVVG